MSSSTTPTEYSADDSGYVTARPSRVPPVIEGNVPTETSDDAISGPSARPPATISPPPRVPPPPPCEPRTRLTARISVPQPDRVYLGGAARAEGETSRRPAPSVVAGVPARIVQGMTPAESHWVHTIAQELHHHRARLDSHRHTIGNLTDVLSAHSYRLNRAAEAVHAARRTIRRLYTCLFLMASALVVVGSWFWMPRP